LSSLSHREQKKDFGMFQKSEIESIEKCKHRVLRLKNDATRNKQKKTRYYWIVVVEFAIIVAGSRRDWLKVLKLTLNTIKQPVERPAMIYLNQTKKFDYSFSIKSSLLLIMSYS
jgi:hypothetical protein